MAFYRNLFPNLTGSDFLAPSASNTSSTQEFVYDWAQHGNTDRLPLNKLPELPLAHVFTYTDPSTAGTTATPRTGAQALDAFVSAYDAATAGDLFVALNPGDLAIITYVPDNGAPSTTAITQQLYVGAMVAAGGTPSASDFRTISPEASTAVNSLFANADSNIILSAMSDGTELTGAQTGSLHIRLDGTLADITSISPESGGDLTLGTTNANEDTVINGASLDVNSAAGVTIDSGTAGVVITGGVGASLVATTGELDLTSTAANVDINAATTATIDAATSATITSGTNSIAVATATGTTITGSVLLPTEESTGTAGTLTTSHKIVVLGAGGAVEHRTLGTVGVGAYTISDESIATNAVTAELNQVTVIPRQQADLTINLPAAVAGDAGSWIKVINNINLANQDDVDNSRTAGAINELVTIPANQHQITITAPAASLFAGGSVDTDLVVDDLSANFELIWDGGKWNVFTT